jgi:DNA-binding response OmpR family regulator
MMDQISSDKKWTLLIVDDNPNEMNSLAIGLRLEGFEAKGVSCGAAALQAMSEKKYDAVLIDLMMPEMNGLQLARAIRAAHPEVTTILMSAYHLSPIQLARAETGAVGFVPKPFRFDELVGFVRAKIETRTSSVEMFAPRHAADGSGLHSPFDVPDSAC